MAHTFTPSSIVINTRKVYRANTEPPDDGLSLLPALRLSNHKVYRAESSINHLTQFSEEKLQLNGRCDKLLAATDQGLAGSFGSSDFEQSAGKFWQHNLLRSEKIQDLSELREQPMGNMSDDSIFHNGAWTRPACRLEYRMEETCQELRDMSFTHTRMSAHLLATPSRGSTALTSYVENEETSCEPFRTQSTEQQFSRSLIYRHRETKQAPISRIAAHWSLHKVHADGDEEERADSIWSASPGALFHQQQFPQEQPYHISSSTSKRHGEVERQRFEKHKSDRG